MLVKSRRPLSRLFKRRLKINSHKGNSKALTIALVTPYSWTEPGGVNIHVRELAKHLRARGHSVSILAPADSPVEEGVFALGRTVKVRFNQGISRPAISPAAMVRVSAALRKIQPDVIHVHEPLVPAVSFMASVASRAPLVVTFHSGVDTPALKQIRNILRTMQRRFEVSIAVSEHAAKLIRHALTDVRVVPNGVETSLYSSISPPKGQNVLFFGRLEKRKGPQHLVAALPYLFKLVPDASVTIAGEGALKDELIAAIPTEFADRVSFPGAFDDKKRVELLANSALVCLPARGESFGYTLVEAMAAGRPVVASDDPGYQCVAKDGKEAILLAPENPSELANALARLLKDPKASNALAKRARKSAARYNWPIVVTQLEAAYREAIIKYAAKPKFLKRGLARIQ